MLRRSMFVALLAAAPLHAAGGGAPCPGQVLYVSTNSGRIYRVDDYWSNPVTVLLGDTGLVDLGDIAVDPATLELLGIEFSTGDLYRIDPQSLQASLIGNPGIGSLNALEISLTGTIYARGLGDQLLYELDPATAAPTVVGDTGSSSGGDLAMEPTGFLLGATAAAEIDRIDPQTGQGTILGTPGLGPIWGLEIDCDGTLYALTPAGDLYVIDVNTMGTTLLGNIGIPDPVYGTAFRLDAALGDVGTNYCGPANLNSTGLSGIISALGSDVVADNYLNLFATNLPKNQFGMFLNSQTKGFVPFVGGSQGNLCLAGSIGRYNRPGEILGSGAGGTFFLVLDLTDTPQPTGSVSIMAGETWNFQAWYRDDNPGPTSNFTDGVSITFL